ncbi:hypothetical protein J6590_042178, partial [Homalodisca vitripennis]
SDATLTGCGCVSVCVCAVFSHGDGCARCFYLPNSLSKETDARLMCAEKYTGNAQAQLKQCRSYSADIAPICEIGVY